MVRRHGQQGNGRRPVALVTGSGGAIGAATAVRLATDGYDVALVDLHVSMLRASASACRAAGAKTVQFHCDQSSSEAVVACVDGVVAQFGRLDLLVNVAGIWPMSDVETMDDELWRRVLAVNLDGAFYFCRQSVPYLRAAGGSIVNVASGVAYRPVRSLAAYAASKAGLVGFTRVLALELAPQVRVNIVAPGPTKTPTHGLGDSDERTAAMLANVVADIPMERMAHPDEVAETIAFLGSDRARFVTGSTIHVNGGRLMP